MTTKYRMAFLINHENNEVIYEHDFSFMSSDGWDHLVDTLNDGKMVATDESHWEFVFAVVKGNGTLIGIW